MAHRLGAASAVLAQRVAAPAIPFDDVDRGEPGAPHAKAEAAGAANSSIAFMSPLDELAKPVSQLFPIPQLAFPDNSDLPPHRLEAFDIRDVTRPVGFELGLPEVQPRLRHAGQRAIRIGMAMPEATMNEDRLAPPAKTMSGLPGSRQSCSL